MTKTVYGRLRYNSDYPAEGGIFAFFSDAGFPIKVVSLDEWLRGGNFLKNRIRWMIWLTELRKSKILYGIGEKDDPTMQFIILKGRESFLENIEKKYPEDLEFFLWHPYFLDLDKESILL